MTDLGEILVSLYLSKLFNFLFAKQLRKRDALNKRRGEDSRRRVKAFSVARLLSRTSKDNSRNYGDFSEEFREIDVILLTGHGRFFVGDNTLWDVTDKGGNRSTEQMRLYVNCYMYVHNTCLVYIDGSSLPLYVYTEKFFTLMFETNKSVVCIRGAFISTRYIIAKYI